jgi:NADH:ubiquinone oxidoreductase subunit|mmetsp:Transcript_89800/g.256703  ORF Transcript_89800/g.256703 Transcript_89800/m.256703 type:complete len:97 (+) Transcript_89800:378-668(+)
MNPIRSQLGDIKFGECVGTDVNGNQYFENLDYPHGQHRWVEYADIHNYDAASVPPEWHGWMTHMQDAPGSDAREFITEKLKTKLEIDKGDHSIYGV